MFVFEQFHNRYYMPVVKFDSLYFNSGETLETKSVNKCWAIRKQHA